MGMPPLSFCSTPRNILEDMRFGDSGAGRMILPLRVSAKMAVRKVLISSVVVIPCFASLSERVPLGMTTPSKTTSAAPFGFFTAIPVPFPLTVIRQVLALGQIINNLGTNATRKTYLQQDETFFPNVRTISLTSTNWLVYGLAHGKETRNTQAD